MNFSTHPVIRKETHPMTRPKLAALLAAVIVLSTNTFAITVDDFYVKKTTWQETMLESVRKLAAVEKENAKAVAVAGGAGVVKATPKNGRKTRRENPQHDLWTRVEKDFGDGKTNSWQIAAEKEDGIWSGKPGAIDLPVLAGRYVEKTRPYDNLDKQARSMAASVTNEPALRALRAVYYRSVRIWEKAHPLPVAPNQGLPPCPPAEENDGVLNGPLMKGGHIATSEGTKESLKLAIQDLMATFGSGYPGGKSYLERLERVQEGSDDFNALKKEALLANPLLDFNKLLMVRNKSGKRFSSNWQTRTSLKGSYENELVSVDLRTGATESLHNPGNGKFIGDICLYFDADKVLFTSQFDKGPSAPANKTPGTRLYSVFEMPINPESGERTGEVRMVSPDMGLDIDNYYACYLPNDRIVFASTAAYEGVPCVGGKSYVANLFLMDRNGSTIRRLTFDQDASWHPSLQANGRVMYVRWEYTDSAHYFSRVMMTMNPDGTDQKAYYGSNSYWPNSMFFPRQIPGPGNSSKFIASITGHHSNPKGGAACIFDVSKGRHEADGAEQFLLGRGKKVEPLVLDDLCKVYSPKFYHSFPLSEKYFLTCASNSVYLVDTFDNMLLIKPADDKGSYWEPIPLRKTPRPPVIPDQVDLKKKETFVLINDIYLGPGLSGVPRGTVKNLRLYRYEFGPRHAGGHYSMGMEAGWDAKQIMGTVPVEADGSVNFSVPANTPFAMQPLDEEGKALQLMRSWTVGMPGERLSCVGCHESQNMAPSMKRAQAMLREPSRITPFYGPMRGFAFEREVQPVLDKYCAGCHDGTREMAPDGLDLKGRYKAADRIIGTGDNTGKKFVEAGIPDLSTSQTAYRALHPFVRRNGPEGDYHLLTPLEFHAGTSELVQMLKKGHHNVVLDNEAWDRLYTWMDLNAPYNGTWIEPYGKNPGIKAILDRRMELRALYANDTYNPEAILNPYRKSGPFIRPAKVKIDTAERKPAAVKEQKRTTLELDLGDGVTLPLVGIPAGSFDMGSTLETPGERPLARVEIPRPFHMGTTEVTLEQFRQFDEDYLNGVYDMHYKDQVKRGYYMNHMSLPVIRVSWTRAMEFCKWLSQKTGKKVTLPTEAQWEWACRAGTETPLSYGDVNSVFSQYGNMADVTVTLMAVSGVNPVPIAHPNPTMDFELKDPRSDDNSLFLAVAGSYQPNPWGLHDMHGNAAEWTRSDYKPYPYKASDGRNEGDTTTSKVIRGGSWKDRPYRCTSSYRIAYPPWQRVFNAGFRVIVEE
jgi:formylglycine-generating enzyme required for sulfatase activity